MTELTEAELTRLVEERVEAALGSLASGIIDCPCEGCELRRTALRAHIRDWHRIDAQRIPECPYCHKPAHLVSTDGCGCWCHREHHLEPQEKALLEDNFERMADFTLEPNQVESDSQQPKGGDAT